MKRWLASATSLVVLGLIAASGCGTSDPCAERRDSPECIAALESAVDEWARAACEDADDCYPGANGSYYGSTQACIAGLAKLTKSSVVRDGVTVTPEELLACASALNAPDCSVDAVGNPACFLPGDKEPGESCASDLECASFRCVWSAAGTCGICQAAREAGASCDPDQYDCQWGLACGTASHVCQKRFEAGHACGSHDECADNLYCAGGKCGARTGLGEPCTYDECDQEQSLFCNSKTKVCDPITYVGVGDPCGYAADGHLEWCAADAYCADDGKCAPRALEGQSCASSLCVHPAACVLGLCTLNLGKCP